MVREEGEEGEIGSLCTHTCTYMYITCNNFKFFSSSSFNSLSLSSSLGYWSNPEGVNIPSTEDGEQEEEEEEEGGGGLVLKGRNSTTGSSSDKLQVINNNNNSSTAYSDSEIQNRIAQ